MKLGDSVETGKRISSIEKAISELRRGAETQFDPRIVEAFVGLVEQGEISE